MSEIRQADSLPTNSMEGIVPLIPAWNAAILEAEGELILDSDEFRGNLISRIASLSSLEAGSSEENLATLAVLTAAEILVFLSPEPDFDIDQRVQQLGVDIEVVHGLGDYLERSARNDFSSDLVLVNSPLSSVSVMRFPSAEFDARESEAHFLSVIRGFLEPQDLVAIVECCIVDRTGQTGRHLFFIRHKSSSPSPSLMANLIFLPDEGGAIYPKPADWKSWERLNYVRENGEVRLQFHDVTTPAQKQARDEIVSSARTSQGFGLKWWIGGIGAGLLLLVVAVKAVRR